jgi:hypothetical protein
MQIQIRIGSCSDFNVTKHEKYTLKVSDRSKNIFTKEQRTFLKTGNQVYLSILSSPVLLDSDPHSQYGSGSRDSQINADPHPDPLLSLLFTQVSHILNLEMAYSKIGKIALDFWVFIACDRPWMWKIIASDVTGTVPYTVNNVVSVQVECRFL